MAMLMLFQGSKHDENRVKMARGPRGANCTSQTSLQVSRKLGDGAHLLHPVLDAPREIRPELDTSAEFSADLLHGSDRGHHPELDHQKPRANRLGYQGHLQIRRPLKLRSWVNAGAAHPGLAIGRPRQVRFKTADGAAHPSRFQIPMGRAQKILAANGCSVTQSFPTTGKPVDTRKTGNVLKTERIAGKAGFPALGDFLNLMKLP